ncbi:MAG TPA: glycosyltransferase family 4 protein [Polyangiaceae bacterium]
MKHSGRFCFLMERQVGIGSAAGAIEPYVRALGHSWTDVTYVKPGGLLEALPLPGRSGGVLRGIAQVRSALRAGPFDALLFLTHNPAVFQPRALLATPTLLWTDVTPAQLDTQAEQYAHPVDRFTAVARVKKELVRHTFRRAAACAGWSNWARASFTADYGVPERDTAVVAPGVDLLQWQLPERDPGGALPRLLFVGGDFERKGGKLLLQVYREQLRGRCELDLVTRDAVLPEPGVRVHHGLSPKSPELRDLYRRASVFVLPTRGDCFSIASMEAMAMGLPVVVTGVGGIPDIVEHTRSGYLVKPDDGVSLREALEPLLADPARCKELGTRGRALVEQRFNAERTTEQLCTLLERIARERHGRAG